MKETALGLLVPEDAIDAPDGPTQIGGNAERADALLQRAGVGGHLWIPGEVSRESTVYGALGTAVKITLPVVKAHQLIEIFFGSWVTGTGASASFRMFVNGAELFNQFGGVLGFVEAVGGANYTPVRTGGQLATGAQVGFITGEAKALATVESLATESNGANFRGVNTTQVPFMAPLLVKGASTDKTNVAIEVQAKAPTGKAQMRATYLAAIVRG